MSYIPLVEHARPRILMLDFSPQDVAKVTNAGFVEACRGATGLLDREKFHFPFAVQDAEIVFAQVQNGSFLSANRTASAESVEDEPYFKDLLRETWQKYGWIVLFVSQNTSPDELKIIGINHLGIMAFNHEHYPESIREPWLEAAQEALSMRTITKLPVLPPPEMRRFKGHGVNVSEDPTIEIIKRYIKPARKSILTCRNVPEFLYRNPRLTGYIFSTVFDQDVQMDALIWDDSADENVIALKLSNSINISDYRNPVYKKGGILLLPDFEKNNVNVALALLQEVFTSISPHLFDTPQHPWLEKYEPASVVNLIGAREAVVQKALQEIDELNKQVETEREKYAWLTGLLVSLGDQFAADTAQALRFLGFEVEEIDNNIAPGENKREDLRIEDKLTGYFALGEAKTVGKDKGPSQEMITKTQVHQIRYGREHHEAPPVALLIINYATDLDPMQRTGRFYQKDVSELLKDGGITALNSIALFDLCQLILKEQLSKEQARRFLSGGQPTISSITLEDVVGAKEPPI